MNPMLSGLVRFAHAIERAIGLHPGPDEPRPADSPLRPGVREGFPAFTARYEGRVPTMYQDVKGYITTGVGNLIDPIDRALSLPWLRASGRPATIDEIRAEWQRVKAMPPALVASRYASPDGLHLDDASIDALVLRHLDGDAAQLARTFPAFPSWPASAQTAALSMAWAMGSGFPARFAAWSDAARKQDWTAAAAASTISAAGNAGVVPRNEANAHLFHEAAGDPRMAGATGPVPQSVVTPAMGAFAVELLRRGTVAFPIGTCETRDFDGVSVRGCAERHTWIGRTGEQRPQGLRGISLYYASPPASDSASPGPASSGDVPMGGTGDWFAALVRTEHGIEEWLGLRPKSPLSALFHDAPELSPIRQEILSAADGVMGIAWPSAEYKAFDPGYRPDDAAWKKGLTDAGYDPAKVTECGRLPGYVADKAGLHRDFASNGLAGLKIAAEKHGAWVPWSADRRPKPADFIIYGSRANGSISHVDVLAADHGATMRFAAAGQGGHPKQGTAYVDRAYDATAGTLSGPLPAGGNPRDVIGWVDADKIPRRADVPMAGIGRDAPGAILSALWEAT